MRTCSDCKMKLSLWSFFPRSMMHLVTPVKQSPDCLVVHNQWRWGREQGTSRAPLLQNGCFNLFNWNRRKDTSDVNHKNNSLTLTEIQRNTPSSSVVLEIPSAAQRIVSENEGRSSSSNTPGLPKTSDRVGIFTNIFSPLLITSNNIQWNWQWQYRIQTIFIARRRVMCGNNQCKMFGNCYNADF